MLEGHTNEVNSLAFAPDGKALASRSGDRIARVWDLESGRERASFHGLGTELGAIAFSPDGTKVATNSASGVVTWDLATGRKKSDLVCPPPTGEHWSCYSVSYGWGVAYSPDGKTLAAGGSHGGDDGFVTLWSSADEIGTNIIDHEGPITAVAFSGDGETVAFACLGGHVQTWDRSACRELIKIDSQSMATRPILAFTPDGRLLITTSPDHSIRSWDTFTGREAGRIGPYSDRLVCLAMSPDGGSLAVAGFHGEAMLVARSTGRMFGKTSRRAGPIRSLAFSPDGHILATGGRDGKIRLWDVSRPR